jgi:thioredoxin-like negative regulator of GroEL
MQNTALSAAQMNIVVAAHILSDKFGALADTGRILAVMAAAVPGRAEIVAAQARNLMIAKNYPEARDLLTRTEAAVPANAVIKSLLALCMYIQNDSLWEAYAEEALALPRDAVAHGIIDTLSKTSGKTLRGQSAAQAVPVADHFSFVGLAC